MRGMFYTVHFGGRVIKVITGGYREKINSGVRGTRFS